MMFEKKEVSSLLLCRQGNGYEIRSLSYKCFTFWFKSLHLGHNQDLLSSWNPVTGAR